MLNLIRALQHLFDYLFAKTDDSGVSAVRDLTELLVTEVQRYEDELEQRRGRCRDLEAELAKQLEHGDAQYELDGFRDIRRALLADEKLLMAMVFALTPHARDEKIPAIKEVRRLTGLGLREAKELVERNHSFPPL